MKTCTKCKIIKEETEFYNDKHMVDGLTLWCKECKKRNYMKSSSGVKRNHYKSYTPTWLTWRYMISRCKYPSATGYKNYGGRGIKVCERWEIYENFLLDMGERPDGMQIDRINNEGNYEPSNCRWVSRKINCTNKRTTKRYLYKGETLRLIEIAELEGVHVNSLRYKMYYQKQIISLEEAVKWLKKLKADATGY